MRRPGVRRPASILLTLVCTALALAAAPARPAAAADTWTEPYPGIKHLHRVSSTPNRIHVVLVDLERADLRVRATRSADRKRTVSAFAEKLGCQVAINGDFFSYDGYPTIGLAIGGGEVWPGSRDGALEGFIAVGRDNRAELSPPAEIVDPPAEWMSEVVSGRPLIVDGGVALETTDCGPHFCARHPRTGVGISADGKTLILATIDGRTSLSVGATTKELGGLMAEMGAWRAINLDGGGSTTMYVAAEGGVVNAPSDGAERVVANHLAVCVVPPFGTLKGFVRDGDVYQGANLVGATVTVSTGQSATTGEDGLYVIADVPRGDVTITATLPGYAAAMRTVYVTAADTTWGSLALGPAPDAGPDPAPDGGADPATPDGGAAADDPAGGCRLAPGRHDGRCRGAALAVVLVLGTLTSCAHGRLHLRTGGPTRRARS